jgi:hypothetical protein
MKVSLELLTNRASVLSLLLLQSVKLADGHCTHIFSPSARVKLTRARVDGFPFVEVDGVMSERWEYVR